MFEKMTQYALCETSAGGDAISVRVEIPEMLDDENPMQWVLRVAEAHREAMQAATLERAKRLGLI